MNRNHQSFHHRMVLPLLLMGVALLLPHSATAQTIDALNSALSSAGSQLRGMFSTISTVVQIALAILGLVAGGKIAYDFFQKEREVDKKVVVYLSGFIFFFIVLEMLKRVFLSGGGF